MINARTTAAAMISTLFVSMATPQYCPHKITPPLRVGTS